MSAQDFIVKTSELNGVLLVCSSLTPMMWVNYFFHKNKTILWFSVVLSVALFALLVIALWQGVLQVTFKGNIVAAFISSIIAIVYYRKQASAKWISDD